MNIGTICFYYPHLGGSGIMATRLAKELALQGHTSVIIGDESTYHPHFMESTGVRHYRSSEVNYGCFKSTPHIATLASKVADVVKKENLDLIHSHYLAPHAIVGALVKQLTGIPHIATVHGSDIHTIGDNPNLKPVLGWSLETSDAVTFVSDYLRRKCKDIFSTDFGGKVIHNFVDTQVYKKTPSNGLRAKLGISLDAVMITHASNFRPIKDTNQLGLAARELVNNNGNNGKVFFVFAGDESAPDYINLKNNVEYAGQGDSFRFLGQQETIAPILTETDIAVMTSIREGCPLFIMESLSSEVPVVSSTVGGIPELIQHGYNGFLYERGHLEKLVELLQVLVDDREKVREMGVNARKSISTNGFSKTSVMRSYLDLYEKVTQ